MFKIAQDTIYNRNIPEEIEQPEQVVSTSGEGESAFFNALETIDFKLQGYYSRRPTAHHTWRGDIISSRTTNLHFMSDVINELGARYSPEIVGKQIQKMKNAGDDLTQQQEYDEKLVELWLTRLISHVENEIGQEIHLETYDPNTYSDIAEGLSDFNNIRNDNLDEPYLKYKGTVVEHTPDTLVETVDETKATTEVANKTAEDKQTTQEQTQKKQRKTRSDKGGTHKKSGKPRNPQTKKGKQQGKKGTEKKPTGYRPKYNTNINKNRTKKLPKQQDYIKKRRKKKRKPKKKGK